MLRCNLFFRLCEYQQIMDKYAEEKKEEEGYKEADIPTESGTPEYEVEDDNTVNQVRGFQDDTRTEKLFEMDDLPHPKDVTPEQVQDIILQYDLPPFPDIKTMGHSPVFTAQEEVEMLSYLKDCHCLGIPRTWKDFQTDVEIFYQHQHKNDKEKKNYVFGNKLKLSIN